MPSNFDNGWERWRGSIDEQLRDSEEALRILWEFKADSDRRIAVLETKLIIFAAVSAALGAMLPGVVQAVIK